ncbi:hypothetical protein G7Y89_g6358 [Cudoniella acicularis]|uniref:Uncharacterized protein n=1 Tax=Cudoniella acicularis TaxID=354080 RepID=A0A8H4RMX3_9HELO|nr:hypothetical protein G7Y89_g6358 [Cudoniella acicularis]
MESTKSLQERYQWKADPKTRLLETDDSPMNSKDKPDVPPRSEHSFTFQYDTLVPIDKVIYESIGDFGKSNVLQGRQDRLASLAFQLQTIFLPRHLEVDHPGPTNSKVETTILSVQVPSYNPPGPVKHTMMTISTFLHFLWSEVIRLSIWCGISRPRVEKGFRRIEWQCDCGVKIYGDFDNTDPQAVNDPAKALQSSNTRGTNSSSSSSRTANSSISDNSNASEITILSQPGQPPLPETRSLSVEDSAVETAPSTLASPAPSPQLSQPKYLALCVNTSGIYKTLAEIEVSAVKSDGQLFHLIKEAYRDIRGFRTKLNFLIKPIEIQFVLCIPPKDADEYEYMPRPLVPLPPMPSEVFIHFLEHEDKDDLSLTKSVWTPRLPRRLHKRMIECEVPTYGWGIHVIEGPNRNAVFWIVIAMTFGSILAGILWSSLRSDIQGL